MFRNQSKVSVARPVTVLLVFLNAIVLKYGLILNEDWYLLLPVTIPMLITSLVISPGKKP